MKKNVIISIMLVVAMLVGCGSSSTTTTTETSDATSSDEQITLTMWCHENDAWTTSYEAVAEKFEDAYPEYTVEVVSYPYTVYNEKIQTALTASTAGPDIVAVWGGTAPNFIETDALSPVPDSLAAELDEDYLEPTLGIYTKEGTYYGVPLEFNLEYGGMIVNKTLFEEAGVEYPATWEELREVSDEVSVQEGNLVTMSGFEMLDTDSLICNYLAMILQQGGQYLEEDDSINFATEEGVAAMNEILSMVANGEGDLENLTNGTYCFDDVYQGDGYMASVGSWGIGEGSATYGLVYGEDYEYVEVPMYGDEMGFASETGWGIVVPANGANIDAAWEFVEFFSQPEILVEHNIACNQLPARISLLESETYIEAMPDVAFLLDILPYGQWMGPYNTSDMRTIFNQMFIDLCQDDTLDVETALREASEQITNECQISYSMD